MPPPPPAPLAVVGLSCRVPQAGSPDAFWQLLSRGANTCRPVPPHVFAVDDYVSPTGAERNKMGASTGNFFDAATLQGFDPAFFGLSADQALHMDPQHRLSLMVAYEALQDAGWLPGSSQQQEQEEGHHHCAAAPLLHNDKAAVIVASTCDDYVQNLSQRISPHTFPGTTRQFLAHRLSHFFGFRGPSLTVDTACNASFVALDVACAQLRSGETSLALVGGVSATTQPQVAIGLDKAHFLSRTGQCKTLDASADGYSRSDAVSFVVVKTLADALRDRDHIYAEILSIGTNHSGEAHSITHPHAPAQSALMKSLLHESRIDPDDVSFVEAHGTGTQAGDWNEVNAITDTLVTGSLVDHQRSQDACVRRRRPLYFTSSKANIGHSEGASGLGALIKTLLIFQYGVIPPHIGICTEMNPRLAPMFGMNGLSLALDGAAQLPGHEDRTAVAICNNFGAAGGNTSVIVRQHRTQSRTRTQTRTQTQTQTLTPTPTQPSDTRLLTPPASPHHHVPIILSAKTPQALQRTKSALLEVLLRGDAPPLQDVSYTLCGRRFHHACQASFVVHSLENLCSQLADETMAPASPSSSSSSSSSSSPSSPEMPAWGEDMLQCALLQPHLRDVHMTCLASETPSLWEPKEPTFLAFLLGYALSATVANWLPTSRDQTTDQNALPAVLEQLAGVPAERSAHMGAHAGSPRAAAWLEEAGLPMLKEPPTSLLAKSIVKLAKQVPSFDIRKAMSEFLPSGKVSHLPTYAWELENYFVPYKDMALITPSWSDDPSRQSEQPAVKAQQLVTALTGWDISPFAKKAPDGTFDLLIHPEIGVLSSAAQGGLDALAGQTVRHADGMSLQLRLLSGAFPPEIHGSLTQDQNGLAFDLPEVQGSVHLHLRSGGTTGQIDFLFPLLAAQSNALKTSVSANVLPGFLFSHMLAQTWLCALEQLPSSLEQIHISDDGSCCLASVAVENASSTRVLLSCVEKLCHWMANKERMAVSSPTLLLNQISECNLSVVAYTGSVDILILAVPSSESEFAAQAFLFDTSKKQSIGSIAQVRFAPLSGSSKSTSSPTQTQAQGQVKVQPQTQAYVKTGTTVPKMTTARSVAMPSSPSSSSDSCMSASTALTEISMGDTCGTGTDAGKNAEAKMKTNATGATGSADGFLSYVVSVIAEETGCDTSVVEQSCFADVGLDSLMSLAVLDRIREQAPMELPGSLFIDCQTVQDLREFVQGAILSGQTLIEEEKATPTVADSAKAEPLPTETKVAPPDDLDALLFSVVSIIAEETGCDAPVVEQSCFADVGLDSLMSLAVLDRIRELTPIELPGSLFIDCQTVQDLRDFVQQQASVPDSIQMKGSTKVSATPNASISTNTTADAEAGKQVLMDFPRITTPTSHCSKLAGSRKTGDKRLPLFLLPDGSGSAAVFRHLPSLGGRTVYGLNSPFLSEDGPSWTAGVAEIAHHYIVQMKEKAPTGPYLLGGWSFGGVVAYEMARQLTMANEQVQGLFLLDSPCPRELPPLPHTIVDWAQKGGMVAGLGIQTFPPRMQAHFRSAIQTLEFYDPPALEAEALQGLHTALLTAVEGVNADPQEVVGTNETVDWLFHNRAGLGPQGWDRLCGGTDRVEVVEIPGNHFTMMERSLASSWGEKLAALLESWSP